MRDAGDRLKYYTMIRWSFKIYTTTIHRLNPMLQFELTFKTE